MVNKKYLLLASFCAATLAPAMAQESQNAPVQSAQWSSRDMTYRGQSHDMLDSSYVPKKRMEQQRKFLNHQYAYPARPRDMWEIGVGAGLYNVMGDVPSLMLWQKGGYGFHAHIRKAWGYVFSTRLQYNYGMAKGLDRIANYDYGNNFAFSQYGPYTPGVTPIYRNYMTEAHQLNLDLMFSTNNIRFHRAQTGVVLYGYVGLGGLAYATRVNALDENSNYGSYADAAGNNVFNTTATTIPQTYSHAGDIRDALQSGMDKGYETVADRDATKPLMFKNKTFVFAPSVGGGIQFRLNPRINLQLEDRITVPVNDYMMDGVRSDKPTMTNYASVGINFNLGNKKKRVEPLYWVNPVDYAYNELNYPRHMMLPDPVLPDADGDGIADQFDKCPGTPSGTAVDTHGCPMDTDGDGVPDYKDKQLITPTECQPVDADGVGKCPCPEGCGTASACGNIGAGSIMFSDNSSRIGAGTQAQLATLAAQMQANPTCKVVIVGAGNGSKVEQQRSWDRVNAVIEYMSEKHGIDRNRFIFQYGQAGDASAVTYRSAMAGEEGPATQAPPFPNLRK